MFELEQQQEMDREVTYSFYHGRSTVYSELVEYFRVESGNAYASGQDNLAVEFRRLRQLMMDKVLITEKEKIKYEKRFSGGV